MKDAIRLRGRDTIEVVVDGRAVVIDGELTQGGPGFSMETSTRWRWADGQLMADADRTRLVDLLPQLGRQNGWELSLNEGPWETPPPIRASFDFRGFDTLLFKTPEGAATVPGRFTVDRGRPLFVMDLSRPWTTPGGEPLSGAEMLRIADLVQREAPANGVVVARVGHRPDEAPGT